MLISELIASSVPNNHQSRQIHAETPQTFAGHHFRLTPAAAVAAEPDILYWRPRPHHDTACAQIDDSSARHTIIAEVRASHPLLLSQAGLQKLQAVVWFTNRRGAAFVHRNGRNVACSGQTFEFLFIKT